MLYYGLLSCSLGKSFWVENFHKAPICSRTRGMERCSYSVSSIQFESNEKLSFKWRSVITDSYVLITQLPVNHIDNEVKDIWEWIQKWKDIEGNIVLTVGIKTRGMIKRECRQLNPPYQSGQIYVKLTLFVWANIFSATCNHPQTRDTRQW